MSPTVNTVRVILFHLLSCDFVVALQRLRETINLSLKQVRVAWSRHASHNRDSSEGNTLNHLSLTFDAPRAKRMRPMVWATSPHKAVPDRQLGLRAAGAREMVSPAWPLDARCRAYLPPLYPPASHVMERSIAPTLLMVGIRWHRVMVRRRAQSHKRIPSRSANPPA